MSTHFRKTLLTLTITLLLVACIPGAARIRRALETLLPHTTSSLPEGADAVWQLVVIGDSSLWGLGEAYARQIEQDMGVKVQLYDCTVSTLSAGQVLQALETGESPSLRLQNLASQLEQAEVVVLFANPNDSPNPQAPTDIDKCFRRQPVDSCPPQAFEVYIADMQELWELVFELREGQPIIVRAVDLYNPFVATWQESGAFESCTACWEIFSQATRRAAEAYGIPFLSRFDAFSGPDHDEDPRAKGLIMEDGQHPSPLASELTAQMLGEMGYEPTIRTEANRVTQ
jgi:lysophospholipase L1-like esterase